MQKRQILYYARVEMGVTEGVSVSSESRSRQYAEQGEQYRMDGSGRVFCVLRARGHYQLLCQVILILSIPSHTGLYKVTLALCLHPQLPIVLLIGVSMLFMSLLIPSSKLMYIGSASVKFNVDYTVSCK